MAEEAVISAPVSAPVAEAAPVAAPAVETTPIAPVVESAAPVVETAPVAATETAPVETAPEAPKPLLSIEAAETKPVDAEAAVETPKTEAETAPLPVYEFKLPEGTDTNNPQFKAFNEKLGQFQNLSKAEQAAVQKFGQEMIDMHTADIKSVVENQNKSAWDWFNNRNKEWLETSKKATDIGGENFDRTLNDARQAISLYGGTKEQQIEVGKMLQETGVENHPALLRLLSNITKTAAKEGTPVATRNTPIQKPGIAQAMYGKTSS